jgi:hypothetical protein
MEGREVVSCNAMQCNAGQCKRKSKGGDEYQETVVCFDVFENAERRSKLFFSFASRGIALVYLMLLGFVVGDVLVRRRPIVVVG